MRFLPILMLLCACSTAERPLQERLRDPDPGVRGTAIWELKEANLPDAATYLIAALSEPSRDNRVNAAMVLEEWDLPEARSALIRAIQDPDEQVRQWAVMALGHSGEPQVVPALRQARSDASADVRHYAEKAIAEIESGIQAKDVRYHPPASAPKELSENDRKVYLDAHQKEWTFVVSRTAPDEMAHKELTVPIGTICEAPPVVTAGAYAGQHDAVAFLAALRRRCAKDPRAVDEFSAFRESCIKLHPRPKPDDEDK
jgi:hypothetical protein